MKTIYKLILKSYIGPMFATFFIVIFILMMNFVWRYIDDLVGKGLDAAVIIELIMYATVNMIQMGLPLAGALQLITPSTVQPAASMAFFSLTSTV